MAWSPDGRRIAYLNFATRLVHTMAPDGTDVRPANTNLGLEFVPAWGPLRKHRG